MTPHVTLWAALAALAMVPWSATIEDRCDVVEVNHFYDENGRPLRETWTQFDPELLDRELLPTQEHRELGR